MPEVLIQQHYFGGAPVQVLPSTVVHADARGRLLWVPVGTPTLRPRLDRHIRDIPRDEWPDGGFPLKPDEWFGGGVLILQPTGAGHSVWWFFEPDGAFRHWYVNLETRSADGAHITDFELDIVVWPDRSWEWKDEESFAAKTGEPRFWDADQADEVRAEGERVIKLVEAGEYPFDGTWCDFRPNPSWPVPGLD